MGVNSKYKNSVFSLLFGEPETLRELYGALEGKTLPPELPVTINTLEGALFMDRCNDISFTIGNKVVVLIEHQATVNPNMPLRLLLYIARVYEKIVEQGKRGSLYREKRIKIPRPEFIVLYNGRKAIPDRQILELGEAFEAVEGEGGAVEALELRVKVYNINRGHNEEIARRSEKLGGYSLFIERVRENQKRMELEEAVKGAVEYCVERGILGNFLREHSTEVINMLFTEWNWDDAKEIWQEEALEEGLEKGREEERGELLRLLEQGYTIEQLKEILAAQK
jgi:hypothetical protein